MIGWDLPNLLEVPPEDGVVAAGRSHSETT
jgi:hypothetical protein